MCKSKQTENQFGKALFIGQADARTNWCDVMGLEMEGQSTSPLSFPWSIPRRDAVNIFKDLVRIFRNQNNNWNVCNDYHQLVDAFTNLGYSNWKKAMEKCKGIKSCLAFWSR